MGKTDNSGYDASKAFGKDLLGQLSGQLGQPAMSDGTSSYLDNALSMLGGFNDGTLGTVAGGGWLGGANPYFENSLQTTRDNVTADVNSSFNSLGRFGSDIHAEGLAGGLATAENAARAQNFDTEFGRMLTAQGMLGNNALQQFGLSDYRDNAGISRLGDLAGIYGAISGSPGLQKQVPWWQQALGYVAGNAGNALRAAGGM